MTNHVVVRAEMFAMKAHAGQFRKYTNAPYHTHPLAVAALVAEVTDDDNMIAAALLHDVLEDTPATYDDLVEEFGTDVADLVREVTDVSVTADGNRAVRKAIDRAHLADASPRAQTIKLADLIHNSGSIARYDPAFAKVYMPEKVALLEVLASGDPALYAKARAIVKEYFEKA
jgi:(p)ppGpp synthase/HD superfamily hydrolase